MARINATVPDEMKDWVDEQPQLNVSGLLQKAIREEMAKEASGGHGIEINSDVKLASNFNCSCGEVFSYFPDDEDPICPRCGTDHSKPDSTVGDPTRHWWEEVEVDSWGCTCGEDFESRDDYLDHLDEEGHEDKGFIIQSSEFQDRFFTGV